MNTENLWKPFSSTKNSGHSVLIKRADKEFLYDDNDKPYIDLTSNWWSNVHGYQCPEIAEAISKQARELPHIRFSDLTHIPALQLTQSLRKLLPDEITRIFYAESGSDAVEAALKVSIQHWSNLGHANKNEFIALQGGYHGETFGAMAMGASSGFFNVFGPILLHTHFIPCPDTFNGDLELKEKEQKAINALQQLLSRKSKNIAAMIVEPIVQGANGMRIYRPQFLEQITDIAQKHEVLVIFDEVMTGFYRTGKLFASNHINITPDIICMGKGITGGYCALSAMAAKEFIYQSFHGTSANNTFMHGHTYGANPMACAAALKSIEILQNKNYSETTKQINKIHNEFLKEITELNLVEKTRSIGGIAAFDIKNCTPQKSQQIKQTLMSKGVLVRPLGNTIYSMPSYATSRNSLEAALLHIRQTLSSLAP